MIDLTKIAPCFAPMRLRPQKHPLPTSETLHARSSQTDADASEKSRFALKAGDHGTVLTSKLYNAKGSAQRTASNRCSAFGERRERKDSSSGESMSDLQASNGQAIGANETLFERIGLGLRHRFSEGEWTDCNGGRANAIRLLASRSRSSTCARRTEDRRYESATCDRRATKSLWRYRCRRSLESTTTLASDKKTQKNASPDHLARCCRPIGPLLNFDCDTHNTITDMREITDKQL
ncbi:DUF1508 domain-containing protein [Lysobacter enzymogenes]|uniref:DUF1508 domain-containing protein n=1 Tax=Lysobacter enzymogenes TaxID=69 RepID=UPI001113D0BD|nr:DUF1508 domain-containing protein [Lysobacter enzymogenes]